MDAKVVTKTITVTSVYGGPGGGAFFYGLDSSGAGVRVKADHNRIVRIPVKGEIWEVTGQFKYHEKYRYQLHAECCKLVEPTDEHLLRYLCTNRAFRGIGIGTGKIAKLHGIFGDGLRQVLERGDINSLTKDNVLTQNSAEKLVAAWHANAKESLLVAFLDQHKINTRLAGKILRYWGERAVEKLKENPYRLLVLTNWNNADKVARSIGIAPNDTVRLIAATEALVYTHLDTRRDTLTNHEDMRRGVRRLIGRVDDNTVQQAIDLSIQERGVVGDAISGYQPLGCALMERTLKDRFTALLLNDKSVQIDLFGSCGRNSLIDQHIEVFEEQESIKLNSEQRRAVHMAATSSLSILKGGAGVGKTTVLKVIHQVVKAMRGSVFQMALAGRAAQRIREATNEDAYTIVGFLNRVKHKKLKPRAGDLIIIDESSMIDLFLMYRLARALPQGARILMVGDPYQLPPIGPGLVFHVLANSSLVPMTELLQVHRQDQSTGIPQIAHQIRNGLIPEFSQYREMSAGVSFIDCSQHMVVDRLAEIINDLGGFGNIQILGVIKGGLAGVNKINDAFHHIMTPSEPGLYQWGFAESDLIIFTANDYDREIFNGSLGSVEKVFPFELNEKEESGSSIMLRANFDGRRIDLTEEDLANLELAYAITVHKAQGSQFNRVVIPISRSRILDRTLIYTALTRGIEQVVFIGDREAFNSAVKAVPRSQERMVGFSI